MFLVKIQIFFRKSHSFMAFHLEFLSMDPGFFVLKGWIFSERFEFASCFFLNDQQGRIQNFMAQLLEDSSKTLTLSFDDSNKLFKELFSQPKLDIFRSVWSRGHQVREHPCK